MRLTRLVAVLCAVASATSAGVVAADIAHATLAPNVTVSASDAVAGAVSTLTYRATVTRAGTLHYIDMALPKGTTGHATVANGSLSMVTPGIVRWVPSHRLPYALGAKLTIPVVGFKMPGAGTYSLGFRAVGDSYTSPMTAGYGSLTLRAIPPMPNVSVTGSDPVAGAISTLTYRATVTRAGTLHYVEMALPAGASGQATVDNGSLSIVAPGIVRWVPDHLVPYALGAELTIPVVGFTMPGAGTYSLSFRAVGDSYTSPMTVGDGSLTLRPTPPVTLPPLTGQAWPEPPAGCPAAYPTVAQENAQPGTSAWTIATPTTALAMYTTATSAACGDTVGLRINSSSPVTVRAYRMGYYRGLGARLVWTSLPVPPTNQPSVTPGGLDTSGRPLNEVDASTWTDSTSVPITSDFVPGTYLFKATDSSGNETYAPLTVRDDTHTHHSVLLQQATATWQAYNQWGGADVYTVPGSGRISDDRPYDRLGAGQYLDLERGLVFWAEQHDVDVTYWTDEDMNRFGSQIKTRANALWLPSHDEYFSFAMRQALTGAIAAGVDVGNFGANTSYRHIEFSDGMRSWDIDRYTSWPASSTWRWSGAGWDEQGILGAEYGCSPSGNMTTTDSWLWAGIRGGTMLPGFMNGENDYVHSDVYQPIGLTVLGSATGVCRGWGTTTQRMDATAYTAPSGARVFNGSSFAYGCFVVQQCPSNWGEGGATPTAAEATDVSLAIGNVARWQGVPLTNPMTPATGTRTAMTTGTPRVINAVDMPIQTDTDQ